MRRWCNSGEKERDTINRTIAQQRKRTAAAASSGSAADTDPSGDLSAGDASVVASASKRVVTCMNCGGGEHMAKTCSKACRGCGAVRPAQHAATCFVGKARQRADLKAAALKAKKAKKASVEMV